MHLVELDERFADLVFFALDYGVGSVDEGGPLVPFVIVQDSDGQRSLKRFAVGQLEVSAEAAFEHARGSLATDKRVAVVVDTFLSHEAVRTDAIVVEANDGPSGTNIMVAQRYRPKQRLRRLKTLGEPIFLDAGQHGRLMAPA
jgi:hypothetical protein